MSGISSTIACFLVLCWALENPADEKAAPAQLPAESSPTASSTESKPEDGVRTTLEAYASAFSEGDVDAILSHWTPGAVYSDLQSGRRTEGQAAIRINLEAFLEDHPGVAMRIAIDHIRLVRDDIADVEGHVYVTDPAGIEEETAFSALLIRNENVWLIDSVHETEAKKGKTPRERLDGLSWLVGRWVDDTEGASVDTTVRWAFGESFLIRTYSVTFDDDDAVLQGTQVIGWDPRTEQIRCWVFDSIGSFGEGTIAPVDDAWILSITRTLVDGRLATAKQVLRQVDEETATVHTIAQELDGELLPNRDPVRIIRVSEESADEVGASAESTDESDE